MSVGVDCVVQRVPAITEQVRTIRGAVATFALEHGAADVDAVRLAITEAVTNVVLHAYRDASTPGMVEVTSERLDGHLEVTVCDEGLGLSKRTDSPGLGMGLSMLAALTQELHITPNSRTGTRVTMKFAVT